LINFTGDFERPGIIEMKSISPITPLCKKEMYHSREDAEDMIRYIQENRIVRELRAYKCATCGLWHLTSRPK